MGCRSERDLERTAGLLEEGIIPPAEFQAIVDHARGCPRCGEVLDAFREARALARELRNRQTIVLPLVLRGRARKVTPRPRESVAEAGEEDAAASYEMAAAMAPPPAGRRPAMVLECPDDRFLVRIVPDASGPGASAVLVALLSEWKGTVAAIEPRLRLGATEYPFGPDGVARLPQIPSGTMSLVLAESPGRAPGA